MYFHYNINKLQNLFVFFSFKYPYSVPIISKGCLTVKIYLMFFFKVTLSYL